jgi:hypothetical protein
MKREKEKKKKLPWEKMEVTRVKLSPEQAVLGCCGVEGPNTSPPEPGCGSSFS